MNTSPPSRRSRIKAFGREVFDPAIIATIALRGWSVLAGLITLLLVSTAFSKVQQGYYYTFASLLALQIFFELGLNFVLTQFVSHESAKPAASGTIGDTVARIAGVTVLVRRWFKRIAIAFVFLVGFGGLLFISRNNDIPPDYWQFTWLVLCLSTGINLYFSPQLAIVEGLGRVKEVAQLRLIQTVVGNLFCWLVLISTKELLAAAMIPIFSAVLTPWWLKKRAYLDELVNKVVPEPVDWRNQIFPMQWRIALSWVSGYLIFQLITPTIFHYSGAVAAGQVGISLAIFNQITGISMSWITAKAPQFGHLIAGGARLELRSLFRKLVLTSAVFNFLGVLTALSLAFILQFVGSRYAERILPLTDLEILGFIALVNHLTFALATFMRAHKTEPMLLNSVVSAILIAAATLVFARFGVRPVLCGYLATSTFIGLPWTYSLFRPFWKRT